MTIGRDAPSPAVVIGFLKNFFWDMRYPWPRSSIEGHVRAVQIKVFDASDFDECLAIYEANIAHGLPPGDAAHYAEILRSENVLILVAYDDHRLVGTFGVHFGPLPHIYWLSFFMTAPDFHRRGIGTTMLLAALALLPEWHGDLKLGLSAVPTATKFYNRFGFEHVGSDQHPSGQTHYVAFLPLTSVMTSSARRWLNDAGATLPVDDYEIPESFKSA